MKRLQPIISKEAPTIKDALWIKPVDGGIAIYALVGNKWQPVKTVNEPIEEGAYEQAGAAEAVKTSLIGSVKDKKTANTINGAKAYADTKVNTVIGNKNDGAESMTLYGLKAYIDNALND